MIVTDAEAPDRTGGGTQPDVGTGDHRNRRRLRWSQAPHR